jgi:hypothetical protein
MITRSHTRLRTTLGRSLAVVMLGLTALAAVECGVRVSGIAPSPHGTVGLAPDHPLHQLLAPKPCSHLGSLEGPFFVEVCTNSLGLRGREHRPAETPRVLGIGDFSTFGWGVEHGDTFLSHLERALRLGLPGGDAGVWNAGLGRTSQAHQHALLRHITDPIHPDVVVLAFSEEDDIDENIVWNPGLGVFPELGEIAPSAIDAYREGLWDPVVEDALYRHSALARLYRQRHARASIAAERRVLEAALARHDLAGLPRNRLVASDARRRFLQAFSQAYDEDWKATEILLERIRREVVDRGGTLVLLRIPSVLSVEDAAWALARERFCGAEPEAAEKGCRTLDRGHTARRLRAYAHANELIYVDPEGALRAATERGEPVYHREDPYLSRQGHARVGEQLAKVIVPLLGGELTDPVAGRPETSPMRRRVGAYFYPWYRGTDWASFTDYTPIGGPYVSTDPNAIRRQLHAAERGEIDFLLVELQPPQTPEARFNNEAVRAMVHSLVERRRRGHSRLEFAMLSDIDLGNAEIMTPARWIEETRLHLDHIWTHFVEPHRDAYAHVDGRPLVGIFSPEVGIDDPRFTIVRPYWVSHEQWETWDRKEELLPFWDIVPQTVTDPRFLTVIPGYNDWRLERHPQVAPYLPRRRGLTLVEQWQRVFDVGPQVALVYSFNEYFEQSQIEPTVEQQDRYLLLNQILARRFKDGRGAFDKATAERLVQAIEPPLGRDEEKVTWVPIGDPQLTQRGLERLDDRRAALHDEAELETDVEADQAFLVGIGHHPTFERCTELSVTIAGSVPEASTPFSTELTQISILRDTPLPRATRRVTLRLKKNASPGCSDAGQKPVVITGLLRYPLPTADRRSVRVDDPRVKLEGFWSLEPHPAGAFVWSRSQSTIHVGDLKPGARYRTTLVFRDTAGVPTVELGTDGEHLQTVRITPAQTAALERPLTASPAGTLTIAMRTATWRPRERFGSEDPRTLGLALRSITLDRVDGAHGTISDRQP